MEKEGKNRIFIFEGAQGAGKSTFSAYARANISSSELYCLSGHRDKKETGKVLSEQKYLLWLDFLKKMQDIPMDIIFDRNFFSEEVYSRLGYKDYSFTDVYENLVNGLCELNYDIYLILLYVENKEVFKERLKRIHHDYQAFSIESSMKQQRCYLDLGEELKGTSIKVVPVATDDFSLAYVKINELLNINVKEESDIGKSPKVKKY